MYFEYKAEGIRGEVQRGIPTVFNFALDFYRQNFELNVNDGGTALADVELLGMEAVAPSAVIRAHLDILKRAVMR